MDESQASPANERSLGDTAVAVPATDTTGRFERGVGMQALYEQMRPDQRTAIAGEFIRMLSLAGDSEAEQFRQKFQEHTQLTHDATDELLSADQVAAIDSYLRQRHPEMIAQLLRHPVTRSALDMPGVPAEDEPDVAANKDKLMSTENDADSGAAYVTSWETKEPADEQAPHDRMVSPGTEDEEARRAIENEEGEGGER
jgi:hypothetical protein